MMATHAKLAEAIKLVNSKLTAGKTREKHHVLVDVLVPCLVESGPDIPDAAVKAAVKALSCIVPQQGYSQVKKPVENVLELLTRKNEGCTVAVLIAFLGNFVDLVKRCGCLTSSASAPIFVVFRWSCVLVRLLLDKEDSVENVKRIVDVQAGLFYGILSGERQSLCLSARHKLLVIWKAGENARKAYMSALMQCAQSKEIVCMMAEWFGACSRLNDSATPLLFQEKGFEIYLQTVVGTRMKLPEFLLTCCAPILKRLSHDQFQKTILPSIQKALLRNPEDSLAVVSALVRDVSLDPSQYASEIGKSAAAQIFSRNENMRSVTVDLMKRLAKQCSDASAIEQLAKHLIGILNGSEGKLSSTEQRISVLNGLSNLSCHRVGGVSSVDSLSTVVVDALIPFVQDEVHEGILSSALSTIGLWAARFSVAVSDNLINLFKKIDGKKLTSGAKVAYLDCMARALKGNSLCQGIELIPKLQTIFGQMTTTQNLQNSVVAESLIAALLLVRLNAADATVEPRLLNFWKALLTLNKPPFSSTKFLNSASANALCYLIDLCERLLTEHLYRLTGKEQIKPWTFCLVSALLHPKQDVRQHAQATVKKILKYSDMAIVQESLLTHLRDYLANQEIPSEEDVQKEVAETRTTSPHKLGAPKYFCEALEVLMTLPAAAQDSDKVEVALNVLLDAHHPIVVFHTRTMWLKLLKILKLDPKEVLANEAGTVWGIILEKLDSHKLAVLNTVSFLCSLSSDVLLPRIVERIRTEFKNPELYVTRKEFDVMMTPEGELCDKSVLESAMASVVDKEQNVKRESKAYSYEEQQWDRELREELKRKKQSAGRKKEASGVQLTKKQQEAIDATIREEAEIRKKLQQIYAKFESSLSLLTSALDCSDPKSVARHLPALVSCTLPLFNSPLVARDACTLYINLRRGFEYRTQKYTGLSVGHATLRLLKPEAPLNDEWCQEPLKSQIRRTVKMIHSMSSRDGSCLPSPAFAYCFPFLRSVLLSDEPLEVIGQALDVLFKNSKIESNAEFGAEFLPRNEMLALLLRLIGSFTDPRTKQKLQLVANATLVQLCDGASGRNGSACADADDIRVLINGLLSSSRETRESALKGLDALIPIFPSIDDDLLLLLTRRVLVVRFDPSESIQKLAQQLWTDGGLQLESNLLENLIEDVLHKDDVVHSSASAALAHFVHDFSDLVNPALTRLTEAYGEKRKTFLPDIDEFGRAVASAAIRVDPWESRKGVAMALERMAPHFGTDDMKPLFRFFVHESLDDPSIVVRKHVLNAAIATINIHGTHSVSILLPLFEDFLANAPNTKELDVVRQAVVVLTGSLARHLDKDDPKVKPIVENLITALSTPSQQVQEAVAACLPPLVPSVLDISEHIVRKLLDQLFDSAQFGERKGAAYGIAAMVKGLGVPSLKQMGIAPALQQAVINKKNFRHREGALFAVECLSRFLGRLYEPHVVQFIPNLLLCFGDNNQFVREAADDTARAIMSQLSGNGVKMVLPALLSALNEDSWRTKAGSVELLGTMAYCAPKQLSACLPNIVPKFMEVLTDSHVRVQNASAQALKQIGSVIKNPEIQGVVPVLLEAMSDVASKAPKCLQALLETTFVHTIDAPSLALIMPILERSLCQRSADTRKMTSEIICRMFSLTEAKDVEPYLPAIMPGLKESILDPLPEVRFVSAKAMGALVKSMGGNSFENLVPWLLETMQSGQSDVDRSGGAQGLCEVLSAKGIDKLSEMMPSFVSTAQRVELPACVRDGFLQLFIYLPITFEDDFIAYVADIIPPILKGLADESEFVRETSLRAGRGIVTQYAETAVAVFLPELENGLSNDNWRIRYSSVQLLGDLLYHITGVTGKMSAHGDEDDNFGTETSTQAIAGVLGVERRNRVLAGLYMGRSDVALMVRQSALHVWKIVVTNTVRMLREILPTLFVMLLGSLASDSDDRRQVAARTLGDVVRKLGERILPEIIPILEMGLDSDKSVERQGVCIGLSEIMASTSKDYIQAFQDSLIPTIRRALCDPLPEVRVAAAKTFASLYGNIGTTALEEILPSLLTILKTESDEVDFALDGLKQVMAAKSRVVLPFLVPKLTASPVNAKALALLSSVAGEALIRHLGSILPALLRSLSENAASPSYEDDMEASKVLVLSVGSEAGMCCVIDELMSASKNPSPEMRRASLILLRTFCAERRVDYSQYLPKLIIGLIGHFNDPNPGVVDAAWHALNAVTEKLAAADQIPVIAHIRQGIKFVRADLEEGEMLPGFSTTPKGIKSLVQILREGILNGLPDVKESAATGLGDVIALTSVAALKPHVVSITGPLIRILGDRYSWNVKAAILDTLTLVIVKAGLAVKPFVPQLQTTFVKALNDANRVVRLRSAAALEKLIAYQPRVDPLFNELCTTTKNNEESGHKETLLTALLGVIRGGGGLKMSEAVRRNVTDLLLGLLGAEEDVVRRAAGRCAGALAAVSTGESLNSLLNNFLDVDPVDNWMICHGRNVALSAVLAANLPIVFSEEREEEILKIVSSRVLVDRVSVSLSALSCACCLLRNESSRARSQSLIPCLIKCFASSVSDIKNAALTTLVLASRETKPDKALAEQFVPLLLSCLRDKSTTVKSGAERALLAVLNLRQGNDFYEAILPDLSSSVATELGSVYKRSLSKLVSQDEGTEDEISVFQT
ncbi:stalled ribosome sensor GCN1-like [Oscarella lobularis]|uniref:stalled ribosome sensor GCN1-like n=1 Tax=Oscarella lobularis TaxID=121494 RepID=UPI003314023E